MKPTDQDLSMLRAFSVGGAMTAYELAAQMNQDRERMKILCDRLWGNRYLDREWVGVGRAAIYTISSKARRLLAKLEPKSMGQMPAPRDRSTVGSYRGERPIAVRAGAMDAYALKSRRGEEYVEHRLPISMAGGEA